MKKDLTQGSILRNIMHAAAPMMIALAVQTGFNIVDSIYVGRISPEAIGAVALAFPIMFFVFALAGGIGVGANSVIARLLGAKKPKEAENVAEHALLLGIIVSVVLSAIGILGSEQLLIWMGAGTLLDLSMEYIIVMFIGAIFLVMFTVANNIFRAHGNFKTPMIAMLISTCSNIILDPIFIFVLDFGVRGAAIATVLANVIGTIIVFTILYRQKYIDISFRYFKYNWELVKNIFKVGIPTSLNQISMSAGMFVLIKIVSTFGPLAITAFGIGFRLDSIAVLPAMGLMMGVIPVVGQNYGAKMYDRVKKTANRAAIIAALFTGTVGLVFLIMPKPFILLFNNDPIVLRYALAYLRIVPLTYIFMGFGMTMSGAFLGTGHAIPALIITILRVIILAPVIAYVMAITFGWGLIGVWWAIMASTLLAGSTALIWFNLGSWKKSA